MTYYLTLDDITTLGVAVLAQEHQEFLIADVGLLQSALARPQTTVFGDDAYPDLSSKAAALMESLARNHALVDGNKRIAWAATVMFLALNDVTLDAHDLDDAHYFMLRVASSHVTLDDITTTITHWSQP